MYSFAQRSDTAVFDEPLYAHYLINTDAKNYHPGAEETIASQENDGNRVVQHVLLGDHAKPVVFFKMMTHFLVNLDESFLERTVNVLLTRDPKEMLPSYAKEISTPTMRDVGYEQHLVLLKKLESLGQDPPVLDAKATLENPRGVLTQLCQRLGIDFEPAMLSWEPGARPEDGCWAKYWYDSVHQSSGFAPYRKKTDPFPKQLVPLYEQCLPYYENLRARALTG